MTALAKAVHRHVAPATTYQGLMPNSSVSIWIMEALPGTGRLYLRVRSCPFRSSAVRQAQSQQTQPLWACTDSREVDDGFLAVFCRTNGNDRNSGSLVAEAGGVKGAVSLCQSNTDRNGGVQNLIGIEHHEDPIMALIKKINDSIETQGPSSVATSTFQGAQCPYKVPIHCLDL